MEWITLFYDGFVMAEPISIISAVIGAGTAIAGGITGGISADKAKRAQRDRERTQQESLMADINQDWLNRSENRQFLKQLKEQYQEQTKANNRMNIVTGATEEQKLAQEEGKNKQFANVFGKMAQGASNFIDNRKAQYQAQQDTNSTLWQKIYANESEMGANLLDNGANFAANSLEVLGNLDWKPKKNKSSKK